MNQLRESHGVAQFSGLLLGLGLYSYHVRELLVCWLFFGLLFALLAMLILGSVVACYAGKYVIHRALAVARIERGKLWLQRGDR